MRDLFRGRRLEREIDDELRFHVDAEIEAGLRSGLTGEQARRAAYQSLGGPPTLVREQIRDARGLSVIGDFRDDLRHGVRLLWRAPVNTAIVLCTLGIAVGGTVTAFGITDAWLFRPLRFPAAEQLTVAFMAAAARPTEPAVWMPYRTYLAWKDSARSFSSVSAAFFRGATWRTASEAKSVVGMRVTPEFFPTLGVPAFRGRYLTAADTEGTPAIVLSHGFWQRELGGVDHVVGRAITLSDISYTIVGVMPADFDVRLLDRPEGAVFWTLFRPGEPGYEPGGMGPVTIVGRLAEGVTIETARHEADGIMRDAERAYPINFNQPDANAGRFVVNLTSLQADNTRTVRSTLLAVLGAALCLMVIASMNVGVLLLSQGRNRRSEVAVRHAVGAGRIRIVRQFLAESLLLSACSGLVGLGLAAAATRMFVAWNPLGTLPPDGVRIDARVLAVATLAMATTTILAGLVPAIRLSTSGAGAALRSGEGGRTTAPAQRAQRLMLTVQIAASTVLLVCAGLLARTVIQLRAQPLGFSAEGLSVAEVTLPTLPYDSNAARNTFFDEFSERLVAQPGVRAVAAATVPPLIGGANAQVHLTADDSPTAPRMNAPSVSTAYFEVLEIPIIAGRRFDHRDTAQGPPVVILNARAAVQLFGAERAAVGRRVRLDGTWREVVGVAGNVHTTFFNTLEWQTAPVVYRPATQALQGVADPEATHMTLWVHIRSDRPLPASAVRSIAFQAGPRTVVLSVQPAPDMVAAATRQPALRMTLMLWFCSASLLLAAIGIYGIVAQSVVERRRDIAIRTALGAPPRQLALSLVHNALTASFAGLTIGVVLSVVLARTLESMLYGVRTADVASLGAAGLVLVAVTTVAAWLPARRATRVTAVHVLRG